MKRKVKNLFILTTISTFLLAGCTSQTSEQKEEKGEEVVKGKYIVENNYSEYQIVIPKVASKKILAAADELASYVKLSTGANLKIVKDNEVNKSSNYISLGNTSVFKSTYQDYDFSSLNDTISAYFISTNNDNIYIYSNPHQKGDGVLYGTYDLLHDLVGYEYYTDDEIYYKTSDDIALLNYKDKFVKPSFDSRTIANMHLIYNQEVNDHYRLINSYRGSEWVNEIYGHSQLSYFVRPITTDSSGKTVYTDLYNAHRDWFSNKTTATHPGPGQLCWTAGEEAQEYVANRFIELLKIYPDAVYFMFGQDDNADGFCDCERCQHAMEEYGMNHAGLQIDFTNHVIEKVNKWISENEPNRDVKFVIYAYYSTRNAPCVLQNGKYVAYSPRVIPHEDLYIMHAPIEASFAFPLDNNRFNSSTYLDIRMWNEFARGHTIMYLYDVNFRHYFSNFSNFTTAKNMYQMCYDYGIPYMLTQGPTDTLTTCFSELREYVESKLMWDLSHDYEDLVKDFMSHYYKEAQDELFEYFETIRDRLAMYHTSEYSSGTIYDDIENEIIYPFSVLRYFTSLFDSALVKIDKYKETNPSLYDVLKARIMKEYLSVIYLKMTLYGRDDILISEAEKAEMKEIFSYYVSYFGLQKVFEGGSNIDVNSIFGD
ncbi:MAG: DUF4838 domain-containing protein [Bacilli bacterium]|nr:DUF4838 domain-containing protein [Bacilli bacterium]